MQMPFPAGDGVEVGMCVGVGRRGEVVPAKDGQRILGFVVEPTGRDLPAGHALVCEASGEITVPHPEVAPGKGKRLKRTDVWCKLGNDCNGVEPVESAQDADFLIVDRDRDVLVLRILAKRVLLA